MQENTAASVREFVWQWQRGAQMTQPTELERAMAAWPQERPVQGRRPWREAIGRGLIALAVQLAPNVLVAGAAVAR
jgi:hypothetical protein